MGNHSKLPRRSLKQVLQFLMRRYVWRNTISWSAWIDPSASIDRTWPLGIVIGENVYIGPYSIVLSHDMSRGVYTTTTIGSDCTIGARALILPGVTIGEGAWVEAGSVVSRDLAPFERVAGNPIRTLRDPAGSDSGSANESS